MIVPALIAAALLGGIGQDRPPPHAYYVTGDQPLTRELGEAQDACAAEAYARIRDRRERFNADRYNAAILNCAFERGLIARPERSGSPIRTHSGPMGVITGGASAAEAGADWIIDGYHFDKYYGFDDAGNMRPAAPPSQAESAAIRRCLRALEARGAVVVAALIDRCLSDIGHGDIFLLVPRPPR